MIKLDSNAAWKEASAIVAANRDVLFTLAGVFVLVPSLLLSVILGEPEVQPGMGRDQMMAVMGAFYAKGWWLILLSTLIQVVGMLAILTLMRDRTRPTVAKAIRAGAAGSLSYLGAQLLLGMSVGLVGGILLGIGAAISPAVAGVMMIFLLCAAVYIAIRSCLTAPLVAVEGLRNPMAILRRSWALTGGNFWRIFAFLALLIVLFLVVLAIVMLVVGVILALATSGETQRILAAVISGTFSAVGLVYLVGVTAAIHRQLAGPSGETITATFE